MAISYTPVFTHTDWVDNVDRVQAGGVNGFNIRFHGLEGEFQQLAQVVTQIDTALTTLGTTPPATQRYLTLTPTLTTTGGTGWAHSNGIASKPPGASGGIGMMSVELPDGASLVSLRATGQNADSSGAAAAAGVLLINLYRRGILPTGTTAELLASVTGTGVTFDTTSAVNAALVNVDTAQFRYYIVAEISGANGTDAVRLFAFQVAYNL